MDSQSWLTKVCTAPLSSDALAFRLPLLMLVDLGWLSCDARECEPLLSAPSTAGARALADYFAAVDELMALEAAAFRPCENLSRAGALRKTVETSFAALCTEQGIPEAVALIDAYAASAFRILLGVSAAFREWCDDIAFYEASPDERRSYIPESPLATLPALMSTHRPKALT